MTEPSPPTDENAASPRAFKRKRETRKSVLIVDKIADWTITIGGLSVIIAVTGIMVFLAQVVVPLFTGGENRAEFREQYGRGADVAFTSTDEYHTVVVKLTPQGKIDLFHMKTGQRLDAPVFDLSGKKITSVSSTADWDNVAFGFEDGTVRFGTLLRRYRVLTPDTMPTSGLARLDDRDQTDGSAVYSAISNDQFRKVTVETTLDAPQRISESGRPIVALDYHVGGTTERPVRVYATADADNVIRLSISESTMNIMTGAMRTSTRSAVLPSLPAGTKIAKVLTSGSGDQVYVAEESGIIHRYDTGDMNAPTLAESIDVVAGDARLATVGFLIGGQSLVVGGTDGTVKVFYRLRRPEARSTDGYTLVAAHVLAPHSAPVAAFGTSQRGKLFITGDTDGNIWLRHSTSEQISLKLDMGGLNGGYRTLLLSPRDDGILAIDGIGNSFFWEVDVPHPETTLKSIFGKIWYEGYSEPTYTWQSTGGTDSFEPKISLTPLIFGTLKATLYALIFAVPIALLAAIYTSEFVHPRIRATVKPTMELMASLPSVVLGFIAALILAPIVETWIAAVLMAFVAVPLSLLFAAQIWQLLPGERAIQLQGLPKFAFMFGVLGVGFYLCYAAGPIFEDLFFAGDIKAWARGDVGSSIGFMFLLLMPISLLLALWLGRVVAGNYLETNARGRSGTDAGLFDLVRWLVTFGATCVIGLVLAYILNALGGDPRGGMVGTYVQRNTLVVSFAMAFAVIPIIYTISEDALNSVPEHLRAASLACGATPWQTAIRVILPTAVSGVFSAVMVGMGRAVGETMIVVMAAGNTAILDWNLFNGLRALSANIAVELPEAVKDGTLYRTLFLAALTLFVMTFIVNTVAEIVRQRFRKRTAEM